MRFTARPLSISPLALTHWGKAKHICVSKLTIIGSDNGLSLGRRQAIIWTNDGILMTWPLRTNFSEILSKIQIFSFKKMHLKTSSAKWRPFFLGLNVLRYVTMKYTMFTGRHHGQCLNWVPVAGISPSSDRVVESPEGFLACIIQTNNGTFPGHYGKGWKRCWVTDGNVQHSSRRNPSEILTISPECTVGWSSYTSGTPLPPNAMVAGYYYAGDSLYVAMLTFPNPRPVITGYYNVDSGLGYATSYSKAHKFVIMDLMILLWLILR